MSCRAPVVAYLRLAPFLRLAFVPTRNIPDRVTLPQPVAHIFYHRRVAEVDDTLPKVNGYWASQLIVTRSISASLLARAGDA